PSEKHTHTHTHLQTHTHTHTHINLLMKKHTPPITCTHIDTHTHTHTSMSTYSTRQLTPHHSLVQIGLACWVFLERSAGRLEVFLSRDVNYSHTSMCRSL